MGLEQEPKIIIEYDGVLSEMMGWQTDRLARLANIGDLRTPVLICRGNVRLQRTYVELGEVLAWKRYLPGKSNSQVEEEKEVIKSPVQSTIFINDEVLTERVKKDSDKRFDDRLFTQEVNHLVIDGLREIINKEKAIQFDVAKYYHSYCLTPSLKRLELLICAASFTAGTLAVSADLAFILSHLPPSAVHIGPTIAAGAGLMMMRAGLNWYNEISSRILTRTIENYPPYMTTNLFRTPADFNPLKHIANALYANYYLLTHGPFVSPKD